MLRIALSMFNEDYVTFPKDDIARTSGLSMPLWVNKTGGTGTRSG